MIYSMVPLFLACQSGEKEEHSSSCFRCRCKIEYLDGSRRVRQYCSHSRPIYHFNKVDAKRQRDDDATRRDASKLWQVRGAARRGVRRDDENAKWCPGKAERAPNANGTIDFHPPSFTPFRSHFAISEGGRSRAAEGRRDEDNWKERARVA